eukprot:1400615-Prorocentrum_lima.AAC.1
MLRERGMGEEGGGMAEETARGGRHGVGGKGEPDKQLCPISWLLPVRVPGLSIGVLYTGRGGAAGERARGGRVGLGH